MSLLKIWLDLSHWSCDIWCLTYITHDPLPVPISRICCWPSQFICNKRCMIRMTLGLLLMGARCSGFFWWWSRTRHSICLNLSIKNKCELGRMSVWFTHFPRTQIVVHRQGSCHKVNNYLSNLPRSIDVVLTNSHSPSWIDICYRLNIEASRRCEC
jgi:hypothetical protein